MNFDQKIWGSFYQESKFQPDNFLFKNWEEPVPEIDGDKDQRSNQLVLSSTSQTDISKQKQFKDKKIKKNNIDRRSKPNRYPTKNFLPLYRMPHYRQIKKYRSTVLKQDQVKEIFKKAHPSMKDYEYLYGHACLDECWQQMFGNKYLYRETMKSRAKPQQRKIFMKKLGVLEEAFRKKEFDRIN